MTFFWLGLSVLASAQAASSGAAAPDPVQLFRSACLDGEVELDPAIVKPETFEALPNAARSAIGRAVYRGPGSQPYPSMPLHKDMPNPIYRIGRKDLFLIATTPEPTPGARFADACIVVSRGDSFEQARQAILPYTRPSPTDARAMGLGYISANDGQHVLTIALASDWTAVKVEPSSAESTPPVAETGASKN